MKPVDIYPWISEEIPEEYLTEEEKAEIKNNKILEMMRGFGNPNV
ncbi:hypothetical protein C942_00504 [Photobacterium marinum]|uniref:Uncharacterized protein n=1 Tax=Photobacterium marinum TaxID=1056511 RepID=L8JF63_9GAMM|nr:hypothetical protein [Photobacterium marinum]ELR66062.1 hypothetical protein C942_00504 [Photobacterium marinum]